VNDLTASTAVHTTAQVLYLFAPLLVSAAFMGLVLRFDCVPSLRRPLDHGVTWRGRRVFGDGKTWRGVAVAIIGSIATLFVQRAVRASVPALLQVVDYARIDPVLFGATMGLGAMLGELPNSFVKRRLGIPPGGTGRGLRAVAFYAWDQIDLLTGAWPLIAIWVRPSAGFVAASFLVALLLHPIVSLIGYAMGARRTPR
jgi:CDP-archaeol synthase